MTTREMIHGWEDLANAIIEQAVDDWTAAKLACRTDFGNLDALRRVKEVERFIHSEYYRTLTNIKPEVMMALMHRRLEQIIEQRERRYHGR